MNGRYNDRSRPGGSGIRVEQANETNSMVAREVALAQASRPSFHSTGGHFEMPDSASTYDTSSSDARPGWGADAGTHHITTDRRHSPAAAPRALVGMPTAKAVTTAAPRARRSA